MWASAVACAWKAISPFRPGKVAYAGVRLVKRQAKMAPTTVNGIRALGFTVSSCDAFDERAGIHWNAWDFISPRVALCFVLGISGNSRQKLATEITFFVVDQNGSRIRTVITSRCTG